MRKENQNCGVGWVLKNHQGRVLWMGAKAYPRIKTALDVEVEA